MQENILLEVVRENFLRIISGIGLTDVVDVLIVAFVVYKVLIFIRETRAEQLVKGLLILAIAAVLADRLDLYTLSWMLRGATALGVIAIVIVFQPELRRALEVVGRSRIMKMRLAQFDKEKARDIAARFIKAVEHFSASKTGALIVFERETALNDIIETGVNINAEVTSELLQNIFYEGAPLHDGAVIVRTDKLTAAGCVLPLSQNNKLDSDLGTRHRAGIGITENSDAISVIVSEETGIISIAEDGKLTRFFDVKPLEEVLLNSYFGGKEKEKASPFKNLFRRDNNASE